MKLYRNWIINEVARAGEHTNERTYVRTYSHTYVRDRPYIPSTTLLCEGIIILNLQPRDFFLGTQEQVRNSRGKRAISIRATEVQLQGLTNQKKSHLPTGQVKKQITCPVEKLACPDSLFQK